MDEEQEDDLYPLYTQIGSPYPSWEETEGWEGLVYADGKGLEGKYPCGLTIGECGCAITSLVMSAQSRGIDTGADGREINPENINAWLEDNNGYSSEGTVVWSAAAKYFGTEDNGTFSSRYQAVTFGNNDPMGVIDDALDKNEKDVLGFKTGHFVFLTEKLENAAYALNDPHWYETQTADDVVTGANSGTVKDYDGSFSQARALWVDAEPSLIKGGIEVIAGSPVELRVTRVEDGLRTGYLNEDNKNVYEIDYSGYDRDVYIDLAG